MQARIQALPYIPGITIAAGKVACYLRMRKYESLLCSFMLLIFGNTFSNQLPITGIADIYQNFLIGLILFYNKKRLRNIILCIVFCSITLNIVEICFSLSALKGWLGILYLVFFSVVAIEVYKELLYSKAVSRELLAAALCGFVLLCLIANFLFFLIESEIPHSFSNIGTGKNTIMNLNYFSFTTLLTIGFGDITPLSMMAKRAVMLMGLAGHFYTVFVTSIIIGKYLSVTKN